MSTSILDSTRLLSAKRRSLPGATYLSSIALFMLSACGGGGGEGGGGGNTYTVGGMVTGLAGSGLVLQNNGGDLEVGAAGGFTFPTSLATGASYAVIVKRQPSSPTQNCVVTHGSGTVSVGNVTNVAVVCAQGNGNHFAFAANADDNTISVYSIDSGTGALAAVGTPVATGLSPHAITVSPNRLHVYVANELSNNISAYAVDAATGVLTPIAGSPFSAGSHPQALAFAAISQSHTYLYVANKGSNDLSAYSVNVGNGVLTPLATATYATGTGPTAVVTHSYGSFVFVANNGGSNDISVFSIEASTGALIPVSGSPFPAGGSPHSLAFTLFTDWNTYLTTFLYTANANGSSSTISGFAVDQSTGVLTALSGSPFPFAVSNNIAIADGSGGYGYLYATTGANVAGYSIDVDTGLLTALSGFPVAAGANAYSMAADYFSQSFYVGNDGDATVSGYKFNRHNGRSDGGFTPIPGSPFAAGNRPNSLATL